MVKDKILTAHFIWFSGIFLCLFSGCFSGTPPSKPGSTPPDYTLWNTILAKCVDEQGFVDYPGLVQDSMSLNAFLDTLTAHPPDDEAWSKEEQIAYWINAYNAFTLKLIITHYPLKSIKDIGSSIQVPFVNSPWDIKFIKIHGQTLDLNDIEHGILRGVFEEARIHFTVNCASLSCPPFRREAYTGKKLNDQLSDQATKFINDPSRNMIERSRASVSAIFDWYGSDFTKNGSLIEFLNQYSETILDKDAKIGFMPYDWSLNEQHPVAKTRQSHHRQTSIEAF